ncbi:sugar phosphate isomerase/epimerase [Paenibacillus sp. P26]|nr:sugar phosphate isomerase/epimerase [Paenibacillus sp. P26]
MRNLKRPPALGRCLPSGSFAYQGDQAAVQENDGKSLFAEEIKETLRAGYDFAELTVGALMQLSEADFSREAERLDEAEIRIPAFNSFIPPSFRLTGPSADQDAALAYAERALKRVHAVGGEIIVFGAGGARRRPDDFPQEEALEQIKDFLMECSLPASKYGITIAIEPLNRQECNVLNKVSEAVAIAEDLHLPNIRVLADAYHMHLENESYEMISPAVKKGPLAHVHYAEWDRSYPDGSAADGVRFAELFEQLVESGYKGKISAECNSRQHHADRTRSLNYIKPILSQVAARHEMI